MATEASRPPMSDAFPTLALLAFLSIVFCVLTISARLPDPWTARDVAVLAANGVALALLVVAVIAGTIAYGLPIWSTGLSGGDTPACRHLVACIEDLIRPGRVWSARVCGYAMACAAVPWMIATTLWPALLALALWRATGYALPLDWLCPL